MINIITLIFSILVSAYITAIVDYFVLLNITGRIIITIITILASVILINYISKLHITHKLNVILLTLSIIILILGKDMFLPFFHPFNKNGEITITATGDKNELANSNEIWINYIKVDGQLYDLNTIEDKSDAWKLDNEQLYFSGDSKKSSFKLHNLKDKDIQIEFLTHAWSGIVNVTNGSQTQTIDLYSSEPSTYLYTFENFTYSRYSNNIFSVIGCLILIYASVTYIVCINYTKYFNIISSYLRDNIIFTIFLSLYVGVCIIFMFERPLFCDELSSLELFIDKGILFTASDYSYPNNHILYNILCSMIRWIDNSYIVVRLISFLSSTSSLFVIYEIGKKIFSKEIALVCPIIYISIPSINIQVVQGRGYSLSFLCFVLGIFCLYKICIEEKEKYCKYFAATLVAGLYTMPAYLYEVILLCWVGGVFLLAQKKFKYLKKLILNCTIAAFITGLLYLPMLFNEGKKIGFLGVNAVFKGVEALSNTLGDFYSTGEYAFNGKWAIEERFIEIFSRFNLSKNNMITCFIVFISFTVPIILAFFQRKKIYCFFAILIGSALPIQILIHHIQKVMPFDRILSWFAILVVLGIGITLDYCFKFKKNKLLQYTILLFISCFFGIKFISYDYATGSFLPDTLTQQAIESIDMADVTTVLCGGDLIHQHMYFLLRNNNNKQWMEQNFVNPDLVILNYNQTYENDEPWVWPDYIRYEHVPWEWVNSNMKLAYCNGYTYVWKTVK